MPPPATRRTRVDEVAHVGHAVLEQVADAAGAVGEQLGRVRLLDVLGQDQHREAAPAAAQLERRAHALVAERGREADVDDRDVGPVLLDGGQQRVAVGDRGHDVEAAVAQQPLEAVAQKREVLGDDYSHGRTARTTVGPPGGLLTSSDAVERRDALRETAQAGAGRVGAAAAVVDDLDVQARRRAA